MDTPSPVALASMILTAPGWARVGIAAPSERMRQAAALEITREPELRQKVVETLDALVAT